MLNMHKGKYAITCKLKYAEICTKYAVSNMQEICTKMHMRNMQYMCIISHNMLYTGIVIYKHIYCVI